MFARLLGVASAGAMTLAAATAYAVDVRNDDAQEHELLLSVWKDDVGLETVDTLIKLAPGEARLGVCERCIVSLGTNEEAESVGAADTEVVTIQKGGLLVIE